MNDELSNKEGHTLIDPPSLVPFIATPSCYGFAVVVVEWLAGELNSILSARHGVEIRMIKAGYMGGHYPALGVFGQSVDLEDEIHRLTEQLLKDVPIAKLISYAASSNLDWRAKADYMWKPFDLSEDPPD